MKIDSFRLNLPICDITPFTLLDYPEHVACIIWFYDCNFRCKYCYNLELVCSLKKQRKQMSILDIERFLRTRIGLLEGVVLSGGECTLYDELPTFIRFIRNFSYKVKLDTNGSNPELVTELIEQGLVDYIALDYKAPREKFAEISGGGDFIKFERTLGLLCNTKALGKEVRTTVHTDLLTEEDIKVILDDLGQRGFRGNFCIQNFFANKPTIGLLPEQRKKLDIEQLNCYAKLHHPEICLVQRGF